MKNFKLNPAATNIECRITHVSISALQTEGWDFDDIHKQVARAQGISEEAAEQYNLENYHINIDILSNEETPRYFLHRWVGEGSVSDSETSDTEQTLKDIIAMLENGLLNITSDEDLSTDKDGNYVPTFIEA